MSSEPAIYEHEYGVDLDIGIDKWIHYNKNVGVDAIHIIGLPGSGKSNMATGLAMQCMHRVNERMVMPGDRFCEWRHFPVHKIWTDNNWKIKILVPKGVEIKYHNFENSNIKQEWIEETDYDKIDMIKYFEEDKDLRLVVIYDQHLRLADRGMMWGEILQQLLNRGVFIDDAFILLFHEAGILLPQMARDKHWAAVNKFSELFVETRKGLVRVILVSQIKTEIESTIRSKCLYKIFRKCWPGRLEPVPIQKAAPFLPINRYIISCGGLYVKDNPISKFKENNLLIKMIPTSYSINGDPPKKLVVKEKHIQNCHNCGNSWESRKQYPKKCPNCYTKMHYSYESVEVKA